MATDCNRTTAYCRISRHAGVSQTANNRCEARLRATICDMTTSEAGMITEPLSVAVSRNIRAEAARHGMSQQGFGDALLMSRASVSDRYRGRTPWTVSEIEAAARLFDIEVEDLLARRRGWPTTRNVESGPRRTRTDNLRIKSVGVGVAERWGLAA